MKRERDYSRLLSELADEYAAHAPTSAALNQRAMQVMIDGGSHNIRLLRPFPPRLKAAHGAYVADEDDNRILDFWQGHFANILGHNPPIVASALAQQLQQGYGLQTGFEDHVQTEVAEILRRQTGAERVRFTTSGALATMYAILLARAFTGRRLVLKVGGGWHGAQPWALKGVSFATGAAEHWRVESQGLPAGAAEEVVVSRFNDPQMLREHFRQYGDELACFIVEPFIGAGGFIFATPEYLRTARELTHRYGVVLIFDEVISGFRFRAGDLGGMYGVKPDLATFAKIIGGGMPVAAVAGRADILRLTGREGGNTVRFSGGTYSAHPLSMLAARTMLGYLVEHESEIYPRIAALGEKARRLVERVFAEDGIHVKCTGDGNAAVPGSSMAIPHFPYRQEQSLDSPDVVNDPMLTDVELRDHVFQLAMLVEDVHVQHGLGSVSVAHTEDDIAVLGEKCRRVARRIKAHI